MTPKPMLVALLAALVAVYVAALAVPPLRHADSVLFRRVSGSDLTRIAQVGTRALQTIDVGSVLLAGSALVLVAARRGRRWRAAGVGTAIVAAIATTEMLKPALGPLDRTLAPSRGSRWEASFPSGHATIAMSLALGAVIAAPRVLRTVAALAGAVYAAGIGVSLVALGWHYPSDVVGGYLVAGAWAAAALACIRERDERVDARSPAARSERLGLLLGGAFGASFVAVLAVTFAAHRQFVDALRVRHATLGAAGVLAAASVVIVGVTAAIAREPAAP